MKRALLVAAGTVVGVTAAVSYVPRPVAVDLSADGAAGLGGLTASPQEEVAVADVVSTPAPARARKRVAAGAPASGAGLDTAAGLDAATEGGSAAASSGGGSAALPALPAMPAKVGQSATKVPPKTALPTTKPTTRPTSPAPTSSAKPTTAPTTPAATTAKTYHGTVVATPFGPVQVAIIVSGGRITDAAALQYPKKDPKSVELAVTAIPKLRSETLAAQSAEVALVSGASYTSQGWKKSLQAALTAAGL